MCLQERWYLYVISWVSLQLEDNYSKCWDIEWILIVEHHAMCGVPYQEDISCNVTTNNHLYPLSSPLHQWETLPVSTVRVIFTIDKKISSLIKEINPRLVSRHPWIVWGTWKVYFFQNINFPISKFNLIFFLLLIKLSLMSA